MHAGQLRREASPGRDQSVRGVPAVGAPVSAGRVLWTVWCLAWAGLWATLDVLAMTGGYGGSAAGKLTVGALFLVAVAAIWLPFIRPRASGQATRKEAAPGSEPNPPAGRGAG
jgi:hypothetical protein